MNIDEFDTKVTVSGLSALKDKWREAKIRVGDMRGLTHASRFAIAEKIGISGMQVAFDTIAPKNGKVEIEASIYIDDSPAGSVYTLADLINELKTETGIIEIQLIKVKWNKRGTDADRNNIMSAFIYLP